MAKFKGENTKVTAAKEKKEAAKAEKDKKTAQEKAKQEDLEWSKGSKKPGKQEEKAQKEAEKRQKKLELEKLKKEEEKEMSKIKPKAPIKLSINERKNIEKEKETSKPIELTATNIDDAIELLNLTNISSDVKIDRHPEKRHKAAYAAYEERELPLLKQEYKGLRLTQLKELLWKNWQKSPENPFNQAHLSHDASQEEERAILDKKKLEVEQRLQS